MTLTEADSIPRGGGWRELTTTLNQNRIVILDDAWIILSTLTFVHDRDTLKSNTDFTLSKTDPPAIPIYQIQFHTLVFDDSVTIRWQSAAVSEQSEFFYNQPESADRPDTTSNWNLSAKQDKPVRPLKSWGNIQRSGSITRGVRVNENGSGDAVSGLNLELSGRPSPDITVKAIVDDRDIQTADAGGSARISQLDKLLLQVKTPHLAAEMGDLDLNWESGRYGDLSGRLKGAELAVDYPSLSGGVVGAVKNSTFHVVTIFGRDGDQGPYELTDKSGRSGVTVVSGSEKVFVDGRELRRGSREGYSLNYLNGQIVFAPSIPINSRTRIEVEYDYSDLSYEKEFYAAKTKFPGSESGNISIEATTAIERSNSDRATAFEWNDEWKELVRNAGDDPALARSSGIDSIGAGRGDYVWQDSLGQRIIRFSQPDSIGRPTGYLNVSFSEDSTGTYNRHYDAQIQTFYYVWAGDRAGNWSPYLYLPLPESINLNSMLLKYRRDNIAVTGEVAVSQWDQNRLSGLNNDDNVGTAWQLSAQYGSDDLEGLSVTTSARHEEAMFRTLDRTDEVDYSYEWNLPDGERGAESNLTTRVKYFESGSFEVDAGGGYLENGTGHQSYRFDTGGEFAIGEYDLSSRYDRVESENRSLDQNSRRMSIASAITKHSGRILPQYSAKYENSETDRQDGLDRESYYWEQGVGATIKITSHQEAALNYQYRKDDTSINREASDRSDTRVVKMSWNGRKPGFGGWSSDFLFHNQSFTDKDKLFSSSSSINAYIRPTRIPLSGRLSYALSTGSQGSAVTVARYVGEGNGDYKREGDRYVPDPDGSFILDDVISDTLGWVTNINSTLQLEWKPSETSESTLPFGFTGIMTRVESDLSSSELSSWRGYVLDPTSYRDDRTIRSDWRLLEELSFQNKVTRSDSRLSFRYGEMRDKYLSGGETRKDVELSGSYRRRWSDRFNTSLKPTWKSMNRVGIVHHDQRSDLNEYRGEIGYRVLKIFDYLELGTDYRYEYRRDAVADNRVDERVVTVPLTWTLKQSGILRVEGSWHKLTASNPAPRYDLTGGWLIGDNYNGTLTLNQQLRSGLKMSVMYRGRWRANLPPRHTGQIEMTATF